jgi:hypothetical protein
MTAPLEAFTNSGEATYSPAGFICLSINMELCLGRPCIPDFAGQAFCPYPCLAGTELLLPILKNLFGWLVEYKMSRYGHLRYNLCRRVALLHECREGKA